LKRKSTRQGTLPMKMELFAKSFVHFWREYGCQWTTWCY